MIIDKFGRMFFPVQDIETMDLSIAAHGIDPSEKILRAVLDAACECKESKLFLDKEPGPSADDYKALKHLQGINNSGEAVIVLTQAFDALQRYAAGDSQAIKYFNSRSDPLSDTSSLIEPWSSNHMLDFNSALGSTDDQIYDLIHYQIRQMGSAMSDHLKRSGFKMTKLLVGTDPVIARYIDPFKTFQELTTEVRETQHLGIRGSIYLAAEIESFIAPTDKTRLGKFYVGERGYEQTPDRQENKIKFQRNLKSKLALSNPVIGRIQVTGLKPSY